jgi:hypothetical protein
MQDLTLPKCLELTADLEQITHQTVYGRLVPGGLYDAFCNAEMEPVWNAKYLAISYAEVRNYVELEEKKVKEFKIALEQAKQKLFVDQGLPTFHYSTFDQQDDERVVTKFRRALIQLHFPGKAEADVLIRIYKDKGLASELMKRVDLVVTLNLQLVNLAKGKQQFHDLVTKFNF